MIPKQALLLILHSAASVIAVASSQGLAAETSTASSIRTTDQRNAAKLTVKGIKFSIDNRYVSHSVGVSLDGQELKICNVDTATNDLCIDGLAITPGPHVLVIRINVVDTQLPQSKLSKSFSGEERIQVAAGEHITFNVAASVANFKNIGEYLKRVKASPASVTQCHKLLEPMSATPICNTSQLDQLVLSLNKATKHCQLLLDQERTLAQSLLLKLYTNQLNLTAERCHARVRRVNRDIDIARLLSAPWEDTPELAPLKNGLWSWARALLARDFSKDLAPEVMLRQLTEGLQVARPRILLIDEIASALSTDTGEASLIGKAAQLPWSVDPTTSEGVRNIFILQQDLPSPDYDVILAPRLIKDLSTQCGSIYYSRKIVSRLLKDNMLTAEEWNAVQAMLIKTSPTDRINYCDRAFDSHIKSEIPFEARLLWLGSWDCSEKRAKPRRGKALASALIDASEELRNKIQKTYEDCLAVKDK